MVDAEIIQYFSHCPQCPALKFLSAFLFWALLGLIEGKATKSWPSFESVKGQNRISVSNSGQEEMFRNQSVGVKEKKGRTDNKNICQLLAYKINK